MPGIVQVQVSRARNLPIMDKSSELTDAFAEVRLFVHLSYRYYMHIYTLTYNAKFSIYW